MAVADDFRFNVDGKMLSVQELKSGMMGTATITTRTTVTPVTVTEVKNGTVMQNLGTSILVRTESGMKMFSQADIDNRGIKIWREGKLAEISDFRANDKLTATIVTTKPPRVMTEKEVNATLAKTVPAAATPSPSTPAPTPPMASAPSEAAATSGTAPRKLPKTASPLPLLALTGFASLLAALALTVRRHRAAH